MVENVFHCSGPTWRRLFLFLPVLAPSDSGSAVLQRRGWLDLVQHSRKRFRQAACRPIEQFRLQRIDTHRPPGADYLRDISDKDMTNTRTVVFDVAWVKTDDKKNVIKQFQHLEGDVSGLATRRLTIDSKEFGEPNSAIDVQAGTAEEWTVINNSDQSHPFHIHVNPFQIVEIKQWMHPNNDPTKKGKLVTPNWAPKPGTWMDTITLPPRGYVRFRSRFADKVKIEDNTYDFTGSFVLHCHILNHEDGGMMVVVNVRRKKAVASRRK